MSFKEILHTILLLGGFIAILILAYFATRLYGAKMTHTQTAKYIKIIDKIIIGNDKSICLIHVGARYFLVGVTGHHIEPIGEIEETDLIPLSIDKEPSFNNLLAKYMGKKKEATPDTDQIQQMMEGLDRQKKLINKTINSPKNFN